MLKIFLISILISPIVSSSIRDVAKKKLDDLLDKTKYDPRVTPHNGSLGFEPLVVTTNVYIRDIEYVCSEMMEWKTQVTFRQMWNDPRLKFDDMRGQIRYLVGNDEDVFWRPDIFFSNSRSSQRFVELKPNLLIRLYPNGNVLYSTRMSLTLSCPQDLRYYPFDSQVCSIQMASYGFTTDDIILAWKEGDPVQVTRTLNMGGFSLQQYSTDYCTSKTNTGEYSCLKLNLLFKRASDKYVCQWFVPTAVLTLISFASFWMKPKSSRIRLLSITLLLLYLHSIYIKNKANLNVSYSTSIDRWLSMCMVFIFAAFAELAVVKLVETLYHKNHNIEEGNEKTGDSMPFLGIATKEGIAQKWKDSTVINRIDLFAGLLFPLVFCLFIIVFIISNTNIATLELSDTAKEYFNKIY